MIPPVKIKNRLIKKLGNDELLQVIKELRKIIVSNSVKYHSLYIAAFRYNSTQNNFRQGVIDRKTYKQEMNKIRLTLYELITSLEDDEIFLAQMADESHAQSTQQDDHSADESNSSTSGLAGLKKTARRIFKYVKVTSVTLIMSALFLINGAGIVGSEPIILKCEPAITEIKNTSRNHVFEGNLMSCFRYLKEKLDHDKSNKAKQVIILQSRFSDIKKSSDPGRDMQEKYQIASFLLEIIDELDCKDIVRE